MVSQSELNSVDAELAHIYSALEEVINVSTDLDFKLTACLSLIHSQMRFTFEKIEIINRRLTSGCVNGEAKASIMHPT